ncbi:hypothetical protein V6Z11_D02G059300 [Gossypium hirsutum]
MSIWQDYWLPGKDQQPISTGIVARMECEFDLILQNPNRWNRDLIYSTFIVEKADQIVSLPIFFTNQSDKVVWSSENSGIYFKKTQSTEEVVTFIRGFGMEYRGSTLTLKHLKPQSMVKWMPHLQGWVKINVDVGFSVAKKHPVSCFIIRNEEGLIMGSGFKATVVLHRLQFALDLGFTNVIHESDSKLVIQNIQQTSEDHSESRPFTWDAKNLARNFSSCPFQFIAREGNVTAHAMAVEGLRKDDDSFWVEDALNSDRRFSRPP